MHEGLACTHVAHCAFLYLQRPGEGIGPPTSGVTDSCELPNECWAPHSDQDSRCLTAELFLRPAKFMFWDRVPSKPTWAWTCYVVRDDLDNLIHLPQPLNAEIVHTCHAWLILCRISNSRLLCILNKHSNKCATPLAHRAVLRRRICKSIDVVISYFKMPVSKINLERKEKITKVSLDHRKKHMEGRNYSSLPFVLNARNTCKGILFKEQILKPKGLK